MGRFVYNSISPGIHLLHKFSIVAIAPLGAFTGSILAGPLLHYAGRKVTVLITSPLWAISWATIALAPSWTILLAARFLCGICAGLCLPSAQIYVNL